MAEVEFAGLKFKGGKIFGILLALSTLIGSLYGGFVMFKDYQDMKSVMLSYSAPDLSGLEKELALIEQEVGIISSEMAMMIAEITLVSDVANELKNDLRTDLRRVESIIEDVEQNQKTDSRENSSDIKFAIKDIQDEMAELEIKITEIIQKTLANPLAGMK
jgi:chromosome segregation ATPase|tara:strand:- start:11 stop:493 length:483 start_codon:yes stop_codon:yes gene_type:complete